MEQNENLIDLAKADLLVSNLILGTTNDELTQNLAAYHTQQAIEKVIKKLLCDKRGYSSIEHDLDKLASEAIQENLDIPEWIIENSYEISRWATTIRYNTNFKTNRDSIVAYNELLQDWISTVN